MSYLEAFEAVRKAVGKLKKGKVTEHLAIQVNLTDEHGSGICYMEATDGVFHAEPYDYRDRDALFTVNSADLIAILSGKLDFDKVQYQHNETVKDTDFASRSFDTQTEQGGNAF